MKAQINHFYKFLLIILITIFLVTGIKNVFASTSTVQKLLEKAEIARLNGSYIKARETLEEAKEELDKQPDSLQKAEVLRKLGNMLRLVGDVGKLDDFEPNKCEVKTKDSKTSIGVLKESLDISSNFKDDNGINWALFNLGNSARVLAEKYQSVNDETKAQTASKITLDCYQNALDKSKNLDDDFTVRVKLNKLSFLVNNQNSSISEKEIDDINEKITKLPLNNTKINARIDLAKSLIKIPESHKITTKFKAEILGKAIAESRQIQDKILESYAVGYLGNLYEQTQQYQEAINLTNQAIKLLIDKKDTLDIQYLWEWQLGRLYEYEKIGKRENAIAAYTRAFNHLEYLKQDLVNLNHDVQYSFKEEVEPVYRGLVNLLLQDNPNQENLKTAIKVMEKLQIAELNNFFRENCIIAKPYDITKIIDKTKDAKTALIYPIVLKDKIAVILYLPDKSFTFEDTSYLQQDLTKYTEKISHKDNPSLYKNQSQKIYNLIMPSKISEKLAKNEQITNLVFVLDTKLSNIPIATLYDGEKHLIEHYSVAVIPSSLKLFEKKSLLTKNSQVLIGGTSIVSDSNLEELKNVRTELNNISDNFSYSKWLLDSDFLKQNIESELKNHNFSIIHFATHGQFSSDQEQTFIYTKDNKLNMIELKQLINQKQTENQPIELLVLSACETAKGDQRAALGLAGIAVRSGSRSTLASLWPINDEFTAEFMKQFYHELIIKNHSKSEALQITQKHFLADKKYKHPYYWGAFVLIGNWL